MAIGEAGKLSTATTRGVPVRVDFAETIENPVICISGTGTGGDAYNLRIVSSDSSGFSFELDEASYHDGKHMVEQFNWIAVAEGTHTLPDGRTIVAGQTDASSSGTDVSFDTAFASAPVVLTSVMSVNDTAMVDSDPSAVTASGFRLSLQGEERLGGAHGSETVGYIAISAGGDGSSGTAGLFGGITNSASVLSLGASYTDAVILGETQTLNEADNAQVILGSPTGSTVKVNLREEKSLDTEVTHAAEQLGLVTFELGLIPCFTRDSRLHTPSGPRRIRDLTPGDLIETADHGALPILWISRTRLTQAQLEADPRHCPVRIRRGALGPGLPRRDLIVSPQHRMLIADPSLRRRFGSAEVLLPAKALADGAGIEQLPPNRGWTYYHVLLEHHAVIQAEGCRTESLSAAAVAQLSLPFCTDTLPLTTEAPPRPILKVTEARKVWADLRGRARQRMAPASGGDPIPQSGAVCG